MVNNLAYVEQNELPNDTGYYLWYILDWGYFEVGAVQILEDNQKHLDYLKGHKEQSSFYVYKSGYRTLTMYHQAAGGSHPHLPPLDKDNKPIVDGYIPFDFRTVR